MQVKKFEAPTVQEALEVIKRELGPEAIILQTRKMKKAFGLMSKESVEVTAAVSERSMQKKGYVEKRLRDNDLESVKRLPATKQGDLIDKYADKKIDAAISLEARASAMRDQVTLQSKGAPAQRKLTATRYADITEDGGMRKAPVAAARVVVTAPAVVAAPPTHQAQTLARLSAMGIASEVMAPAAVGMSLEEEFRHLKRMLEEVKTSQEKTGYSGAGVLSTPALQDAFDQLVLSGLDRKVAHSLVKKASFELGDGRAESPDDVLDQIAVELMDSTPVNSMFESMFQAQGSGPRVFAIVGPTGVGKTTTLAKLASEAGLKRGMKVGLINLDQYKIGAGDQLETYAKILKVAYRSVGTAEELNAAMMDFKSLQLVLIDTAGRSQRDPSALQKLHDILSVVPQLETQLVLAATTRDAELYDQAHRFSMFTPSGVIFSKLDEATTFGTIYNVAKKSSLPLSYFTTGQRVPEDLEVATRERLAALIMDL